MKGESWKYLNLLLLAIGISNIGDWIYHIALNVMLLQNEGAALAVTMLYILKPLAAIVMNSWAGSLIDRLNKRYCMIFLDILRGLLIIIIPFCSSLGMVYVIVFLINMASAVFQSTSIVYLTKITPQKERIRFNSLRSLVESGGFILGPAIAGGLLVIGTPYMAIYVNGISFFISGIITFFLPNVEKSELATASSHWVSLQMIKEDWKEVLEFSHKFFYVAIIYFLFQGMLMLASAIDPLEAVFAKEVLLLSNRDYGILVSIAGVGIAIGAFVNAVFSNKVKVSLLLGTGACGVSIGYVVYGFSENFLWAAIGFFVLSFALAFANTGFTTFYQNQIPIEIMGRVNSVYGFIESIGVICTIALFGILTLVISIQKIVMVGTLSMLLLAIVLLFQFATIRIKSRS